MPLRVAEQASRSDVGRQRSTNEDAYLIATTTFAVADGMGGARAGEVASGIAIEMLEEPLGSQTPEGWLERVAEAANQRIFAMAQEDESRSGMGTTMTAAIVAGAELAVGHVGDSRLYRFRDDSLERLTRDHSLVEELVREGKLAPEEVESHPQRAIITRALGPSPSVEVETFTVAARAGDVYLICSDGLTTMVKEDRIGEILRSRSSLDDAATRLVNTANENGGRDNVTVVLFRLAEADLSGGEVDQETRADLRVEEIKAAAAQRPQAAERDVPMRPSHPPPTRRHRLRSTTTAFFVLLSIGVLVAGFWFGTRQFYFVGDDAEGRITLSRGVPWTPLGVELFETLHTSSVAVATLPPRQQAAVLDSRLRSEGDAADLVRSLEEQQAAEGAGDAAADDRRDAATDRADARAKRDRKRGGGKR